MTRTILPNTSAREQRLLGGLGDRTTYHWAAAPLLRRGGQDDIDAGTGTVPGDGGTDIGPSPLPRRAPSGDPFTVEHSVYTLNTEQNDAPTSAQFAYRRRGAHFLRALTDRTAL